jgi:predicted MPP superfamily phosphohydrolase
MRIVIIHLSDIHLKENSGLNFILSRTEKISNAILGSARDIDFGFLVVSGDIAFSGRMEEYKVAEIFFDALLSNLNKGNFNLKIILVPGNHDCDFSSNQSVRNTLIKQILYEGLEDDSLAENCESVQSNFYEFRNNYEGKINGQSPSDRKLSEFRYFDIGGKQIQFLSINSAWISTLPEKQGLFFPIEKIQQEVDRDKSRNLDSSIDLSIAIFHHPYTWFEPDNSKALRKKIESISDIVLTGHEHDDDIFIKSKSLRDNVEYLEGGVLQEKSSNISEFNMLIIDIEQKIQYIYQFSWDGDQTIYKCSDKFNSIPFIRNKKQRQVGTELNQDFQKEINDIGIIFSHPSIEKISLNDIFIYPELRRLFSPNSQDLPKTLIREDIPQFILDHKKVLIVGSDKSGKTILAKKLFSNFLEQGLTPVLINGEIIREYDDGHIETYIKREIAEIYLYPEYPIFQQLEKSKKIIIIDDFHKSQLRAKDREKAINTLLNLFEYVLIIGNEQLSFGDLFFEPEKNSQRLDFIHCEIMGFGHVKRAELIQKWFSLGDRELVTPEHDLLQSRIRAEKIVSSLLGNNLIPPYPFFILSILQQMEIGTPVSAKSGSYGYLYEALLTLALEKIENKGIELDIIYNYLSQLAYHFYINRLPFIPDDKLRFWHSEYCQKKKFSIDLDTLIKSLQKISVLNQDSCGISFRYPYIYYYFAGRYMSEHIHEREIKNHIANMSERLHQTESANIIIFLCYLSKDPFILTTLLYTSHVLFDSHPEFNIDLDTKSLGNLLSDLPPLILNSENIDNNHTKELEDKDEIELSKMDEPNNNLEAEGSDELLDTDLEEFLQINVALKTIQILGQLLRNFPGSWDGNQKQELVQECDDLGLRVLYFAYNSIENNREGIAQKLGEIMTIQYPKWDSQRIYENVQNKIFSLLEGLSFIFIKHISDSVGHDRFSMTFNDLLQSNPNNPSYEFIDLSIHLDYYKDFPKSQIIELSKKLWKNKFAFFLLKHLVWYYFYIYQAPFKLKQSICDKLGIPTTPQLGKLQRPKINKR